MYLHTFTHVFVCVCVCVFMYIQLSIFTLDIAVSILLDRMYSDIDVQVIPDTVRCANETQV